MAIVNGPFDLHGSAGEFSFYKRKDIDKTIARRKGGPSRQKVLHDPKMAGTRRVNAEFAGRSAISKWLLAALRPLKPVSDYNWSPALNKLLRPIQVMDTESLLGQRSVCLSKAPHLQEGFQLNRMHRFEDILPNPVHLTFSETGDAMTLAVPALLPGSNFLVPAGKYDWYSLVLTCAAIPDFFYTPHGYRPTTDLRQPYPDQCTTGWLPVTEMAVPRSLALPISGNTGDGVLVTSIGIFFGKAGANGQIEPVKHVGAGKILSCRL